MKPIDLRSDTVTLPTDAMRSCMANADVGDDVFGEDPSVNRLETIAAELTGKQAALFVTSGTQGNLVSLLSQCGRGDAAILGKDAHINVYEGGGLAALGGIMPCTVDDSAGIPSAAAVEAECLSRNVHYAQRVLLCLENTHNRRGGVAIPVDIFRAAAQAGRTRGLRVHLDGARLFNACIRWDMPPTAYTDYVDSVQLCLSKGLGAPMGSVICADTDTIAEARHWRKRLGGGMRQAGIAAAAGIYALEHNRERLQEDHTHAALLADHLSAEGLPVEDAPWRTNMVFFSPLDPEMEAKELVSRCEALGVRMLALGERRIRVVTHLGITSEDIECAANLIAKAARQGGECTAST